MFLISLSGSGGKTFFGLSVYLDYYDSIGFGFIEF